MKVSLVVAHGAHLGKEIPIKGAQFVIGRDPECQLRPASPMISRRHCAVLVRQGKVYLRDFGSTNGTQLNGQRVEGEVELHHEDRIKADPLIFTIHIEEAPLPQPADKPGSDQHEDDSIADMLLDGSEEIGSALSSLDGIGAEVPLGTTVMEIPAIPETEPDPKGQKAGPAKKDEKKPALENTAAAAKLLLDKYTRRKRP
jgi:predicted component of type VI protein secretion system